jgi:transcription elongation factor Elf1
MKVVKNNYQKTLGFTRCIRCGSVLCIQKTDVEYGRNGYGKNATYFYCGACGHRQEFRRKDLTTKKKALGGEGE